MFDGVYKNRNVLITGDSGFKGSWLALWLNEMGANVVGYSKDIVSSPSHHMLLKQKYKTYYNDILDLKTLHQVFADHKPEIVFHLAAQSLVSESYTRPIETYATNVLGTLHVLEEARKSECVKAFINVTTDKVYENGETLKSFKETDRLGGFDLYSSSKACSEILSTSYRKSFLSGGFLLATVRAGNVIGGGDWAKDRLIPDIMKAAADRKICEIRNPDSVRPWQHVLEPLSGYLVLGQKLLEKNQDYSGAWNFGPARNPGIQVKTVLEEIKKEWGEVNFAFTKNGELFHEASVLKINSLKAAELLGWKQVWDTGTAIKKTTNWYKNYYLRQLINTPDDLKIYVSDAKKKKISWAL